jgi:adenine/guanine phosphoribosyltransferase-like PRPP-binding protein
MPILPGAALIDDVVTTGATAAAASDALGGLPALVLAGTIAPMIRRGECSVEVV